MKCELSVPSLACQKSFSGATRFLGQVCFWICPLLRGSEAIKRCDVIFTGLAIRIICASEAARLPAEDEKRAL